MTTAKYINILKADFKSSFSKQKRHLVVSIYNFLLRKWTKYILSPYVHYIQHNSTIAIVQQITNYSQSSVVNTFIKPGIRKLLVLKKNTHKTLRGPYRLSKGNLNQRGSWWKCGRLQTVNTARPWPRTMMMLPKYLYLKPPAQQSSRQLLHPEFPHDFHCWLRYLGKRSWPTTLPPKRKVNKRAEPWKAVAISFIHWEEESRMKYTTSEPQLVSRGITFFGETFAWAWYGNSCFKDFYVYFVCFAFLCLSFGLWKAPYPFLVWV